MLSYLVGKIGSHWKLLGVSRQEKPPVANVIEMKAAGYTMVHWTNTLPTPLATKRDYFNNPNT